MPTEPLAPDEILALHRALVALPSVSGGERAIADFVAGFLAARGATPQRLGDSVLALAGAGPLLLLDSHLDTVPPGSGWTRAAHEVAVVGGRVHGLGANDAKAAVAALIAAFLATANEALPFTLALALVEGEETRGIGTETVVRELASRGLPWLGAIVGEPTELDFAVAQKGLLILELASQGTACHAAHAAALGVENAAVKLARDLVVLADAELAPADPLLGATSLQPTVVRAGEARNSVPGEATAVLDLRTTPVQSHATTIAAVRARVASEVRVLSQRLEPRATPRGSALLEAARRVRPRARLYGSPTLSDWALLPSELPAIKCGPGASERSHTADEYVEEEEILAGARFYADLLRELATSRADS